MNRASQTGFILITGSTGFVGHYLVAELLRRGRRCAVLLRPPLVGSLGRLGALLGELGVDAASAMAEERLVGLEGDLAEGTLPGDRWSIDAVVHAAAVTAFEPDAAGEPYRTNVRGTRHLLDWASSRGIADLHLVSSAYSCGRVDRPVAERFNARPDGFHNAYEDSKHQAERCCLDWGRGGPRRVTLHRPSVVVGEWGTGRATKFGGFYLSARAAEFLDRSFPDRLDPRRMNIPLRLKGRPGECQNIVPVDYVAGMIAAIVTEPARHGRVYHLVHPDPPSNARIKSAFEHYFGIAGGRFVPPEDFDAFDLNEYERRFYEISRPIEHYFLDTPTFLRDQTATVEAQTGIGCPAFDLAAIERLLAYAQSAQWGRRRRPPGMTPGCALYFEAFLPAHVGRSQVARMTALSAVMRFIIEDEPDGEWVCRFDGGRLSTVHRGRNGLPEQFGYRTTREVFWEAVSGRVPPQDLFLSGRAEVFGDVERALKMAMILHAFTREFPCTPAVLAGLGRSSCSST
ncbi:MAG: SDR family oxidoreductase [Phycisphaerae bacterium]|jgi:nucleoside-diphosphate-sugar epimerase